MRKLHPISSNLLISFTFVGALLLGACTQSKAPAPEPAASNAPTHASLTNEFSATAPVVAVDAKTRVVTLRGEEGNLVQVKCGPDVKNFAQISAGDTLHIRYSETLEATRLDAGEPAEPATAVGASVGAEPGAAPAGGVGLAITARVKVESLDLEHDIVVFSLASGQLSARRLVTPEGREFAKGLKIGDTVELVYTEVLGLAIEKV